MRHHHINCLQKIQLKLPVWCFLRMSLKGTFLKWTFLVCVTSFQLLRLCRCAIRISHTHSLSLLLSLAFTLTLTLTLTPTHTHTLTHTHTHFSLPRINTCTHTHTALFSLSHLRPGVQIQEQSSLSLLPPNLSVDVTLDLPPYNKFWTNEDYSAVEWGC